jgi:tetraacyldisaccharide 4'-kinase
VLNHIDIILLDDAMQHRSLNSDINVLLTDYQCVFSEDYLFPVGKLRDLRERASIADIILVTKSPSFVDSEARNITRYSISKYSQAPVFFSSIIYKNPLLFFKNSPCTFPESAILVTGIANHSHIV